MATVVRSPRKERKEAKAAKGKKSKIVERPMRGAERKYRQRIKKVDLMSVMKVATGAYLFSLVVFLLTCVVLWAVLGAVGTVSDLESFIGSLLGSKDFEFLQYKLLAGAAALGIVFVLIGVIFTMIAAAFYNLFSDMFGGVEVVIIEEDLSRSV